MESTVGLMRVYFYERCTRGCVAHGMLLMKLA
jgi:hypothetical protein